jgi:hypothetical protein
MKLQATVDKLFSHKMFSNKYFLYAVVAASILTNYMRIVESQYEVVGFFILVGIIMMNFSKNVAVVLTICLLLTQIIMAGKAIREGARNMPKVFKNDLKKYMTPEQLKLFESYKKTYNNASATLDRENVKLSTVNNNIANTKTKIDAAQKEIADNNAAHKKAKNVFSNASPKDKAIKKQQLDISINASKLSHEKLVAQKANIVKFTNEKSKIEKNIAETKKIQNLAKKNMHDINVVARAAKAAKEKADADAKAVKAAKEKAVKAAKDKAEAEAKARVKAEADARAAKAKAEADARAAKAKANASKPNTGLKATRAIEQVSKKSASDYKKATKKVVSNVLNRKHGQKATPFKVKNRFALLSDNDDDMDYENNGIDFLEPSNLTSVTQGTTNLMTKQKDLFSFMNSMTPLIENAKKMLSGLDLSKLQA